MPALLNTEKSCIIPLLVSKRVLIYGKEFLFGGNHIRTDKEGRGYRRARRRAAYALSLIHI